MTDILEELRPYAERNVIAAGVPIKILRDTVTEIEQLRDFIRSGHGGDAVSTLKEMRRWEGGDT